MSDAAARVASATGVPLDRASFYLDAAAGDEAGAVAMIRGAGETRALEQLSGAKEKRAGRVPALTCPGPCLARGRGPADKPRLGWR